MADKKGTMQAGRLALTVWVCLVMGVPEPGAQAGDRYEKWLDEVRWIISRSEKETFQTLRSPEEKRRFVQEFWRRRDPTPGTPRNEYKEEYYRRWEYVNQHFQEGMAGWRTDRGRVYLIHGPPQHQETFSRPGGNAYGVGREGSTIVWKYSALAIPTQNYSGPVVLVFQADVPATQPGPSAVPLDDPTHQRGRPLFTRSGTKVFEPTGGTVRYRLVAAGPPSILSGDSVRGAGTPGLYARNISEILRSPGDLIDLQRREEERQARSRLDLQERIGTQVFFGRLPVQMTGVQFFEHGHPTLVLTWRWPLSQLQFQEEEGVRVAKVDLLVQVRDSGAQEVLDEFFKSFELRFGEEELQELSQQDFWYVNQFHLSEGRYRVLALLRDVGSSQLGSVEQEFECSRPNSPLLLSDLVVGSTVRNWEEGFAGEPLRVQDWQVLPEPEPVFSPGQKMVLLFRIYGEPQEEVPSTLLIHYKFLKEGRVFQESGARQLTPSAQELRQGTAYSTIVDLSSFEPGPYQIQVSAIDFRTRSYAIKRTHFTIH